MIRKSTKLVLLLILCISFNSCKREKESKIINISKELQITQLSDNSYIHTSYIYLESGSKFPSNGFIYADNKKAYVFDTPANDQATLELINWLKQDKNVSIKGVVFNHFHRDCTEGADILKKEGIPTIASKKTAKLMLTKNYPEPNLLFKEHITLQIENKTIVNQFFGEAHTSDNIISYFPDEKIIFGGCMIKSLDAKKGNLEDANINEWSNTVSKIKDTYPEVEIVIPGHGDFGDQSLLDYTISLFKTKE